MLGWRGYFGFCETPEVLVNLDSLGPVAAASRVWRQWKNAAPPSRGVCSRWESVRGWPNKRPAALAVPGASREPALSVGLSNALLRLARPSAIDRRCVAQPARTAVYGPVRTVVWQGSAGNRRPYADQVA